MISLDTNILVRIAVHAESDDSVVRAQRRKAQALLMSGEEFFVPITVVQELEWVLRAVYDMPSNRISEFLEDLLSTQNIRVDRAAAIRQAIAMHQDGFDFSDALLWAQSGLCASVKTFDQKFVKLATAKRLNPVVDRAI